MTSIDDLCRKAKDFEQSLPYQLHPYNKRNWGSPLHSLCSYQGKLKPALAHFLVGTFTQRGDVVLDPLSGVGTIPFEACLQGRVGVANDISMVAFASSYAKVQAVCLSDVQTVIADLAAYIESELPTEGVTSSIKLNINGPLQGYYHPRTFQEIVAARQFFQQQPVSSAAEALVFAALLHILHGNRPYALSRRSHPITPFAPTGPFEYRSLVPRLTTKALAAVNSDRGCDFAEGRAALGSFESLASGQVQADAIITSPPFYGSTRFYMANWIRLWFAGWEPADFQSAKADYLETRQQQDMDVYKEFFGVCEAVLKPGGVLILHLGKSRRCNMAHEVMKRVTSSLQIAYQFDEDVSAQEKHGVSDKGVTDAHQFVFMLRR